MAVQIVVLINPIPDLGKASLSKSQATLFEKGPRIMDPSDRNALEFALQIREKGGQWNAAAGKVTVTTLMLAPSDCESILKETLALEADQAVLLSDPAFQGGDDVAVAVALARAVSKLKADLTLSGAGIVGHRVAEEMKIPSVVSVSGITFNEGRLQITTEDRPGPLKVSLPLLASVLAGSNTPRIANAIKIMKAAKREVLKWTPADLNLATEEVGPAASGIARTRSFLPESG
ncbi:MAG: hypothetical protein HY282_06375 [Nitrospirae bacterium]|nr:hypothetical protein [Candidatus Manganitrophaceae bacterium]